MNWLAWWNLIFILPAVLGILLLAFVSLDMTDDSEGDPDLDGEGTSPDGAEALAGLIGIGQLPLPLWLGICALAYGLFGLGINLLAGVAGYTPGAFAGGILGGLSTAALAARLFRRFLPRQETYAGQPGDLVGCTGRVVNLLSTTEGYAQVRDHFGNLQQVRCQSDGDARLTLNQTVLVVSVDPHTRNCLVVSTPGAL